MKRFMLILFLGIGTLLLTGCGNKETTQTTKDMTVVKNVINKITPQKKGPVYKTVTIIEGNKTLGSSAMTYATGSAFMDVVAKRVCVTSGITDAQLIVSLDIYDPTQKKLTTRKYDAYVIFNDKEFGGHLDSWANRARTQMYTGVGVITKENMPREHSYDLSALPLNQKKTHEPVLVDALSRLNRDGCLKVGGFPVGPYGVLTMKIRYLGGNIEVK